MLLAATPLFLALLIAQMHSSIFYRYALAAAIGIVVLATRALYLAAKGDLESALSFFCCSPECSSKDLFPTPFLRPDIQPPLKAVYASAIEPHGGYEKQRAWPSAAFRGSRRHAARDLRSFSLRSGCPLCPARGLRREHTI